jgi:hypothetical protein
VSAIAGYAGAVGLSRFIQSMLFATSPVNVPTLVGVSLLFLTVALAACLMSSRRAASVDPCRRCGRSNSADNYNRGNLRPQPVHRPIRVAGVIALCGAFRSHRPTECPSNTKNVNASSPVEEFTWASSRLIGQLGEGCPFPSTTCQLYGSPVTRLGGNGRIPKR